MIHFDDEPRREEPIPGPVIALLTLLLFALTVVAGVFTALECSSKGY